MISAPLPALLWPPSAPKRLGKCHLPALRCGRSTCSPNRTSSCHILTLFSATCSVISLTAYLLGTRLAGILWFWEKVSGFARPLSIHCSEVHNREPGGHTKHYSKTSTVLYSLALAQDEVRVKLPRVFRDYAVILYVHGDLCLDPCAQEISTGLTLSSSYYTK